MAAVIIGGNKRHLSLPYLPCDGMFEELARGNNMQINHARLIRALPANRLEDFVNGCHELWRGTGNMGRAVTGYVTEKRVAGPCDNFACKQLGKTLSQSAAFLDPAGPSYAPRLASKEAE